MAYHVDLRRLNAAVIPIIALIAKKGHVQFNEHRLPGSQLQRNVSYTGWTDSFTNTYQASKGFQNSRRAFQMELEVEVGGVASKVAEPGALQTSKAGGGLAEIVASRRDLPLQGIDRVVSCPAPRCVNIEHGIKMCVGGLGDLDLNLQLRTINDGAKLRERTIHFNPLPTASSPHPFFEEV